MKRSVICLALMGWTFGGTLFSVIAHDGFGVAAFGAEPAVQWFARATSFPSKRYMVKTDLPREEALALAGHMDTACDAYVAFFSGLRVRRPARLNLWLFATQDDYVHTLRTRLSADGTGSQGMCISRGSSIVLVGWRGRSEAMRMKSLLQHEGFHQFASALFPGLPRWAGEGLAELFERGVVFQGQMLLGEVSAGDRQRLLAAVRGQQLYPLDRFFMIDPRQWNAQVQRGQSQTQYLQAWCLVHFFAYADEGRLQLPFLRFLMFLNRGLEWKRAFVQAFGVPHLGGVQAQLQAYIQGLTPTDYRETVRRLEFLSKGVQKLGEDQTPGNDGGYPMSLDALKAGLRRIGFEHTSNLFDQSRTLKASDDPPFEVPYAGSIPSNPTFRLVAARGRKPRSSASGQETAKDKRTRPARRPTVPPDIVTVGLRPQEFAISWQRSRGGGYAPVLVVK